MSLSVCLSVCLSACLSVCLSVCVDVGTLGGQKRVSDLLELEVIVNCLTCILGTELGSSSRAASALNNHTISSALIIFFSFRPSPSYTVPFFCFPFNYYLNLSDARLASRIETLDLVSIPRGREMIKDMDLRVLRDLRLCYTIGR